MRSYLITEPEAARLPRLLLLALCVLYVLPGFLFRDAWTSADITGLGVALDMARGGSWLMPQVQGWPLPAEGPLPFWLAGGLLALLPALDASLVARLVWILGLAGALAAAWYAVLGLARRPEAQPPDPFGASPSAVDYGRAIADVALLLVVACLGALPLVHETTADALGFALPAFFLLGCTRALDRPRGGAAMAGLATGAAWLSVGPSLGLGLLAALLLAPRAIPRLGLVTRPFLAVALTVAALVALPWFLVLAMEGTGRDWLADWWLANAPGLGAPQLASLPVAWGDQLLDAAWFLWPAWPVAAWTLWRGARGRLREPLPGLPGLLLGCVGVSVLVCQPGSANALLSLAVPAAVTAAAGLPTLSRRALSLIDWFAVMAFSLLGVALWAYWLAWQAAWPPRMAASVVRLVPGLDPTLLLPGRLAGLAFALVVSLGWLLLVRWRLARRPRALWRSVVLSAGGMVLSWSLLMSLWLPALDWRRSLRPLATELSARVPVEACVATDGVRPALRAGLLHFGGLALAPDRSFLAEDADEGCAWLLRGDAARHAEDPARWQPVWQGRARGPRGENLRLWRRLP